MKPSKQLIDKIRVEKLELEPNFATNPDNSVFEFKGKTYDYVGSKVGVPYYSLRLVGSELKNGIK